MADVLLTHSYHLPYDPKQVRKMQPYPPLGTLYAAAALLSQGISVAIFDTMLHDPIAGFPEALSGHHPKIVAIYEDDFNFLSKMCLTRMRELAWQIAGVAQASGAIVIAHGSDATDHADDYLRNGVDYVLLGEAEETLSELCGSLLSSKSIRHIAGVIHRNHTGHSVRHSPAPPRSTFWINHPNPARELIDLEPYRQAWTAAHGYFSTNLVASRGCPYKCNWCAKPISGDKFHVRPAEAVAAEIRELKNVHGVQHVWFGDDVFALSHRWTQQFAREMETMNCVLPFKIQSRADLMTPDTVAALKRAGCAEVWMGVESGSQKVLDAMDKGLKVSDVIMARGHLENAGIRACYFLQLGYPGEDWGDIRQTIELVRSTRPHDIGISVSYPLPGTLFYERVQAELGPKRNWTDSDDLCGLFKAAYTDEFYHGVRNALHSEVDSWRVIDQVQGATNCSSDLWRKVYELEPLAHNIGAIGFLSGRPAANSKSQFISLHSLSSAASEV